MRTLAQSVIVGLYLLCIAANALGQAPKPVALFDGKTLAGWESKYLERWRVEDGAIVSGDEKTKIPDNFFLFG